MEKHISYPTRAKFNTYIGENFPPGPKIIPIYVPINLQKGLTLLFCLYLMRLYNNWSTQAILYTVAHGSYGLIWIGKHYTFPDKKWEKKITIMSSVWTICLVLGPYWVTPYLLISRTAPPSSVITCCIALFLYIIGVVIMMCSDVQKYSRLSVKPGSLITNGMFRYIRHPNYLGEMMIYGSFAMFVWHWLPCVILLWVWNQLFFTNIYLKEKSMEKYQGWQEYKEKTGLLLPSM
jgi:protein-S-isoprenylcysteine O-methyltransferase Ste14